MIRSNTGLNSFAISVTDWAESTGAIGITARAGRYGGTFAHRDIAFEFGSWISPSFKLMVIREFQRLKTEESVRLKEASDWSLRRTLSKVNYRIHTDAVKNWLVPPRLQNTRFEGVYFASEADVLNAAMFGMTAAEWRTANPERKGNLRDHATGDQLLGLANLESHNAEFIRQGLGQSDRLQRLNEIAIYQMEILVSLPSPPGLPSGS